MRGGDVNKAISRRHRRRAEDASVEVLDLRLAMDRLRGEVPTPQQLPFRCGKLENAAQRPRSPPIDFPSDVKRAIVIKGDGRVCVVAELIDALVVLRLAEV